MLPNRRLETLTYRDKIHDLTQLVRGLTEHLEQSLSPRAKHLQAMLQARSTGNDPDLADVTVRNLAATLLESCQLTGEVLNRIDKLGNSIVEESEAILNRSQRDSP